MGNSTLKPFNPGMFREQLAQFIGTEHWYKTILPHVTYTDGVKFMAEQCSAYWLIDLIVSYQTVMFSKVNPFQVWKITKTGDCALVRCENGNDQGLKEQKIEYTDFPLSEFELWCVNGVIMIPSEY